MAESKLRAAVIRLASQRRDLRSHLLPLLGPSVTTQNSMSPSSALPPAVPTITPPAPMVIPPYGPPPGFAQALPMPPQPYVSPNVPQTVQPQAPVMPNGPIIVQPAAPAIIMSAPPPQYVPVAVPTPDANPPPLPPVLEGAGLSDVFLTSRTQQGFLSDLAPEMDRMLSLGMTRPQVAEWAKIRLRDGFRHKDPLYMILIRHQSTFESDDLFRQGLERAIDVWRTQGNYANQPGV